jgi:hypothetical protein
VPNVPPVAGIPSNVLHRVVMISNSVDLTLGTPGHLMTVMPHQLQIPEIANTPWKATFSINNAIAGSVTYTDCYNCAVYSLEKLLNNPDLQLNAGLVTGDEVPDHCSVRFFDVIQGGQFDAYQLPSGAGVAVLTVNTDGNPVLAIQDRASTNPPQTVTLQSPAILEIHNHGNPGTDKEADFLLSYLATNEMSDITPPLKFCSGCQRPSSALNSRADDLDPACSNSNYP